MREVTIAAIQMSCSRDVKENIEKAAIAKGYEVKVETNGSSGAENILTEEEIKQADAIIIAADTKVKTARFNGK